MNYVLVDYENVQPRTLPAPAKDHKFCFLLFAGPGAPKPDFDFAAEFQKLGPEGGQYVKVAQSGNQSIDLHIAERIGYLRHQHPQAHFHIISKDKDFDPLVKTLQGMGVHIARRLALTDVPGLKSVPTKPAAPPAPKQPKPASKPATPQPAKPPAAAVSIDLQFGLDYLQKLKNSKPATLKTLQTSLQNYLQKTHNPAQVSQLITALIQQQHIRNTDGKISYS